MEKLPPKTSNLDNIDYMFGMKPLDRTERVDLIQVKDEQRKTKCRVIRGEEVCLSTPSGRAQIAANDNPELLVDTAREICSRTLKPADDCLEKNKFINNLKDMDKLKLWSAELDETPWSDDYWPLAAGATAKRYDINPTPDGDIDWKFFHQDYLDNPTSEMIDRGLINKLHTGERGRTLQLRLEHGVVVVDLRGNRIWHGSAEIESGTGAHEVATAAAAPARALAVPGEAHRAGPHLAQALDDVLVRQVVAARLGIAVLADLAAELRRDRHALEGLAEGPGLPRELLCHVAAVAAPRRDDLGDDVVGHSICERVHELRAPRRVAVPERHAGLLEGTIQIRRTEGIVIIIIILLLAHVLHHLDLDARRRDDHVLGQELFLQDGRRINYY